MRYLKADRFESELTKKVKINLSKKIRALIIEDSEDDALLLVHELRRKGYDITFKRVETAVELNTALDQQDWNISLH